MTEIHKAIPVAVITKRHLYVGLGGRGLSSSYTASRIENGDELCCTAVVLHLFSFREAKKVVRKQMGT